MCNELSTGYPAEDKPWLKYYTQKAVDATVPECSMYEYVWEKNKNNLDDIALIYFHTKISYRELFKQIDHVACALMKEGVKKGDIVTLMLLNQPEMVYLLYALNKIGAVACMINVLSSAQERKHYL